MQRFLEILLGLNRGFLSREGELSLTFNPLWPWQQTLGAVTWNALLIAAAIALVVWIYRREGRTRGVRITLGLLRGALLLLVIALLNRPVLTLGQSYREPSVLAVLIDDSLSMRIRDAGATPEAAQPRLAAAVDLLTGEDQQLLKELAKTHELRFYRFDTTAAPISPSAQPSTQPSQNAMIDALHALEPSGQSTQLASSLRVVMDDLQGQRVAGIVLLSDGRESPARPLAQTLAQLKDSGVKVFPVPVGSDQAPTNIEVQSVAAEDAAFKGDIVNVRAIVRATGLTSGREVTVRLNDKKTGAAMTDPLGKPLEQKVTLADDAPTEVELQFQPTQTGPLDLVVEAVKQPGEVDEDDNLRGLQIEVLDAKIAVLYVEGYPRWEYRYIKNEMMRDRTVDISCLLTSADPTFAQEGDRPISRFPESMDEMLAYDAIVMGDVDPDWFSDAQLQLINDFVAKKSGGFGMIAGTQSSPQRWRGTVIESLLPVDISRVQTDDPRGGAITTGFRPVLTREGAHSSIFRFFADKARNEKFIKDEIQMLFWYAHGVRVKRGVGEVLAEHPIETDPDGRKAPLLVLGHYGGGRTLFSAIDDSWRFRYYTGETVFDTYWVQQFRYLARAKKLGQRRVTFVASRPVYELGQQVRATLRVLDPQIVEQLPEQLRVEVQDAAGQPLRQEMLVRQEGSPDTYNLSFTAQRIGQFAMKLPSIASGIEPIDLPFNVAVPKLELSEPQVNRAGLAQLASETRDLKDESRLLDGQASTALIEMSSARTLLPRLITSAARVRLVETPQPLWDAPLTMILFVLLITGEWVLRKVYGML